MDGLENKEEYLAGEIKHIIMNAINKVARKKGFAQYQDSTRVITLKKNDYWGSRISYSCDFCIVNEYQNNNGYHEQYIHFQKSKRQYHWNKQSAGYHIENKIEWISNYGNWNEVLEVYIYKKNHYDKKSRALYAETINEAYQCQHRY